jgi:secretion/DNA translocation related TadE-like protein
MDPEARDGGAITVVVAAGALLLSLAALAVADLGSMLVARARARAAADAAALAAVVRQAPVLGQGDDPEAGAREAARDAGAELASCACRVGDTDATVTVQLSPRVIFLLGWAGRRVRATARARLDADVFSYRDQASPSATPG